MKNKHFCPQCGTLVHEGSMFQLCKICKIATEKVKSKSGPLKMKFAVTDYKYSGSLVESDPYNRNQQAPIYLVLDWDNRAVYIETMTGQGIPERFWHRRADRIFLPRDIDATRLEAGIKEIEDDIQEIYKGYYTEWNGSNWIGDFSEETFDLLEELRIRIDRGYVFSITEVGGLWHADDWFCDIPDEITADSTDEEIEELAREEYKGALAEGVGIVGGLDEVIWVFREYRKLKQEENLYVEEDQ